MAKKNKQEYDNGYQAAIDAIKKQIEQGKSPMNAANDANDSDIQSPNNPNNNGNNNQNGGGGKGNGMQDPDISGNGGKSRTSASDENQGVVRPEDCIGPDQLDAIPSIPGSMLDRSMGDKITEAEGYDVDKTGADADEKEWKDAALKAARQMPPGDKAGNFKSKIEGLYKPAKNWKRELQKIVGHCISPDDKRQAFANKNILISQDRIARTDKDKYDSLSYIIAIIDSSGSMTDDQLKICLSEVYQMALQKKPLYIWVIQCDTKVQDVQRYGSPAELKKSFAHAEVKGRGGTDFAAAWKLLKDDMRFKRGRAELVMLFTDGWCDQYKRDPKTMENLCWVILDNPGFNLKNREAHTKCVYLNTADIKK